jgi:hypothetical protein
LSFESDVQNIGSIDNTNSATTTTYSSSVTSLSISFMEQWSSSQTTEFSFSVPGGKRAFTYQGYLLSKILRYDPSTDNYTYLSEVARFVTNILSTSEVPLVDSQ